MVVMKFLNVYRRTTLHPNLTQLGYDAVVRDGVADHRQ